MYAEPQDLDRDLLVRTLRAEWGLSISELRYEPVGFGTHHYVTFADDGTSWFVNVDDLTTKTWISSNPVAALDGLGRSLRTASRWSSTVLWWALAEITGYVESLRAPHEDNADAREAWKNLKGYVSEVARRPTPLRPFDRRHLS